MMAMVALLSLVMCKNSSDMNQALLNGFKDAAER
jgi:hypothetical protein